VSKDVKPVYRIGTGLSARVSRLNAAWCEENPDQSANFKKAMSICEEELLSNLYTNLKVFRPAYSLVKKAFEEKDSFHPCGEFIFFEKSCPWKSHLFKIEEENSMEGHFKFAIFQDERGMYRVQAVPQE